MNEIEHDGKTYILKTQVEAIIKERVSKIAARATDAESRLEEASKNLEQYKTQLADIDMLNEQISALKKDLASNETKFNRFKSMSKFGILEPDLVDAIETIYDKSMQGKGEKEQIALDTWLETQLSNLDDAPILIRPHLKQLAENRQPTQPAVSTASEPIAAVAPEIVAPPRTNAGAVPAPEGKDILKRASDPSFYSANHEAIRAAWEARYNRG